jgi:hypothetical protein
MARRARRAPRYVAMIRCTTAPRAPRPAEEVEAYLIGRRESAPPEIRTEIDQWLKELRSRSPQDNGAESLR